ncbi:hypothetical protein LMG23992_01763 [Cupriavidus laharis]|uniref:Uncharacterized protein n=1 Tax=Cupriavidus laharis TaxID=151654 RepID=A0ABM8WTB3_9BURK|nr:hypothetical protein [Cupriavidus laharis]CAG9170721.1 hypothetical protein LMG23992_01763 [Cupriavidus laharis]
MAVLMAMIVIAIMLFMGMPVIVTAAGFATRVFVWQGVFRCRASHFFLSRWFDLMPLKTL